MIPSVSGDGMMIGLPTRIHIFTLVEVLVAVLILGLSLGMVMQIIGGARNRLIRAEERWSRAHVAEQAMEFYLLAGVDGEMPEAFLPEGFSVSAEVRSLLETRPEGFRDPIEGWLPVQLTIRVRDDRGDVVVERTVDKLYREEDLILP